MKVKITYLEHSGFLLEWDKTYWLFDYYRGEIPSLDNNKMLVVFVSHSHGDHFNPEIFKMFNKHTKLSFIISSDIKLDEKAMVKYNITEELSSHIKSVKPNQEYEISDGNKDSILINTLKSTDMGVAFVVSYKGKIVYHAGDLNLWVWKGEDKQFNNNMKANFQKEILKLKDLTIDLAFAPLDPRQDDWSRLGVDELLNNANVNYLFPMHLWDKLETIQKYKDETDNKNLSVNIMDIKKQGQNWSLEL
jgi:L-ascorbate metabolism protein UlaG (beta-lactamase superfamily)